jgi:hypothetical protein
MALDQLEELIVRGNKHIPLSQSDTKTLKPKYKDIYQIMSFLLTPESQLQPHG